MKKAEREAQQRADDLRLWALCLFGVAVMIAAGLSLNTPWHGIPVWVSSGVLVAGVGYSAHRH